MKRLYAYCRRGYTLLEICFALFILAVMLGAALPSISGWLKEERLRAPARQLSLLARTARLAAIQHQQPYQIIIRPDQIWIEPVNPPASPDGSTTTEASASPTGDPAANDLPDRYNVPSATAIFVQPWYDNKMTIVTEWHWTFQASGLCEPIAVKFTQGASELELDFDPLTATVANEKYVFP
jgi:prepilin-type N-terminal cleavage/methylation domain-containing protein